MGEQVIGIAFAGIERSKSINIETKRIFNGRWSTDEDGEKLITEAKLGETIFFHTDLEGYKEGDEVDFKLFDYDEYLGVDVFDEDDYQFPTEEIHRKTTVKKVNGIKRASVELYLNENWEQNLKDDIAYDIELYWKMYYENPITGIKTWGTTPKEKENFLKVEFSDQTLFFKPAATGEKLPQLISGNDGSPLFIVKLGNGVTDKIGSHLKSEAEAELKSRIKEGINNKLEEALTNIALVKIAQRGFEDASGKAYPYAYNSFKKETIASVLEKERAFVTENHTKIEVLTMLTDKDSMVSIHNIEDTFSKIFDIAKFNMSSLGEITSEPLDLKPVFARFFSESAMVGVGLWLEFLNYIALKEHNKQEAIVDAVLKEKLDIAKTKGLNAVQTFLHTFDSDYDLLELSSTTLAKLLTGDFKNFDELNEFNLKMDLSGKNPEILYRSIYHKERGEYQYVIETIFINE